MGLLISGKTELLQPTAAQSTTRNKYTEGSIIECGYFLTDLENKCCPSIHEWIRYEQKVFFCCPDSFHSWFEERAVCGR